MIPIAERSGLIVPLGRWVLERACRQRAEWAEQGLSLPITVNVSAHQLVDERFALAVLDARRALRDRSRRRSASR